MKPGETATRCVDRSPFAIPSDSAYEAPSEMPPSATLRGSIATRSNVCFSAASHPVPLLVLLHGGGGRANYFRFTFPLAEEAGVVVLTLDSRDNTWDAIDSPYGPDVRFIDAALQHTFARVAIDPHRVALGGISDGASYALSLGIANGDLFTHLVAVSPGFIAPPSPPVGRPLIFVAHGTRDNVYSVEGTRHHIVPRLKDSGYDVTYREFDGPHSMIPPTARQVIEWLVR